MPEPAPRRAPATGAVRLRAMTAADGAACAPLLAQLGYEMTADELERRWSAVATAPDHAVILAEADGRIVGLMHVFARPAIENPREAVVQALVVAANFRRSAVGRRLMRAAEAWGAERDCRSVVLSSNITRAPAHAFYEAIGYSRSATAHIFRKLLAPPDTPVTGAGGARPGPAGQR